MSAFSEAADAEDGDTIARLQADNEQLRQACKIKDLAMQIIAGSDDRMRAENTRLRQELLTMHGTLEKTARFGAAYVQANKTLRDSVIRWAARAEEAEEQLAAIGAGGVGSPIRPQAKQPTTEESSVAQAEPVAWLYQAAGPDGWNQHLEWTPTKVGYYGDWERIPLYTHPQPSNGVSRVLMITTAYEQGVGKGHQAHRRGAEIDNPYSDSECHEAWALGYKEGQSQAARSEQQAEPVAWKVSLRDSPELGHWLASSPAFSEVYISDPLYTSQQQAQQPLTKQRIDELIEEGVFGCNPYEIVRRLEEERGVFMTRPLTDEQILDLADPFGAFEYGDAQGHKRKEFARAIERAHGIGGEE